MVYCVHEAANKDQELAVERYQENDQTSGMRLSYRSLPITKLDTVAPDNDLPSQISVATLACKVLQRIRIPYPAIVHQGL